MELTVIDLFPVTLPLLPGEAASGDIIGNLLPATLDLQHVIGIVPDQPDREMQNATVTISSSEYWYMAKNGCTSVR